MRASYRISQFAAAAFLAAAVVTTPLAQEGAAAEEGPKLGWGNTTDLSYVLTQGNSSTQTLGLDDRLTRRWKKAEFLMRFNAVKSDTADDRFRQIESGLTWPVGGNPPPGATSTLVEPPMEPDVEKYWIEPSYSRKIRKKLFWTTGASWNRDVDAGLINRYVGYATVGNNWWDKDEAKFRSTYGLSYTDREEDIPDPTKDQTFAGARLSTYFLKMFGKNKTMTYENDWDFNTNISAFSDFSTNMLQSFAVKMTSHLSLKVSLQWQYNNEPALVDIDLVARVILIDPDGIPGSGDEFFETVDSGGAEIVLGEVGERKKQLDTIFRTSLSIKF
jgi:hypothetical protein